MFDNLSKTAASHITGSTYVVRNRFFGDDLQLRERRTVGQMFFQPYESGKEFIYCARHTFVPMLIIGLGVLDPIGSLFWPVSLLIIASLSGIVGGISSLCGNLSFAATAFEVAAYLVSSLVQTLIDILVLPLSILVMLTRGVSTGLQAAGIYNYDEVLPSEEDTVPANGAAVSAGL